MVEYYKLTHVRYEFRKLLEKRRLECEREIFYLKIDGSDSRILQYVNWIPVFPAVDNSLEKITIDQLPPPTKILVSR